MAKFVCTVCGYVYEGDAAPEFCPVCKAPASKFQKQDEEMSWAAEHVVGVDIFVEVVIVFIVYVEARIFHKGRCPEEYEIRRISGCQVGYVALLLAVVIVGDLVLIAVQAGRAKHARLSADAGDLDNTAAILRRFLRLRRRGLAAGGEYEAKGKRGTDCLFHYHHPEHGSR